MGTDVKYLQNNTSNPVSIALLLGMVFLFPCYSGCSGNKTANQQHTTETHKRLVGKWKVLDGNFQGTIIEFTAGGIVVANTQHKWMPGESLTGTYSTSGNSLTFTENKGLKSSVTYEVEYPSTSSVVTILKKDALTGFSGFDGRWERIGLSPTEALNSGELDFTGLRGVLAGKWRKVEESTAYSEPAVMDFTEKSVEETRHGFTHVGKYVVKDELLTFTDRDGDANDYGLEFVNDGEIALRPEKVMDGTDFNDLSGRWKRISSPPNRIVPKLDTGPIADAKRQVQRIEQKLTKLESVLNSALSDRDDLAAKLRSLGVNSPADLKNNVRGMRLAENVVKLASEIDGLEQQLALIDGELLKARSIVRRMEREQASLPEEELRNLATQLREAEERTDGTPLPVTPLDVDAAVEKALSGSTKTTSPKTSK